MLDQDNSRLTVRNGMLPSGFLLATGEDSGDSPAAPSRHPVPPGSTGTHTLGPATGIALLMTPELPATASITRYCSST